MGGADKFPGISLRVLAKIGTTAFPAAVFLFWAWVLSWTLPAFSSDHLFESFSGDLPASARTVFFFDLRKLRESSFRPSVAGESAPGLLVSLEKNLSGRKIDPEFTTGAFFITGGSAGLLLDSSLTPKNLASPEPSGAEAVFSITEKRTPGGYPVFLFEDSRDGDEKPDDALACAFPGRPGRLLVSTFSGLSPLLRERKGVSRELQGALEALSAGSFLEGVLTPDFTGMEADSISPLWNGVGRIAFAFFLKKNDPYPFRGSVLFFPRTPAAAGMVRRNVEELVRSAYAAGREKGEIRPEMMFAFQVLPGSGFTELRIRLTGPDAEDFVSLFTSELSKGVFGKCL